MAVTIVPTIADCDETVLLCPEVDGLWLDPMFRMLAWMGSLKSLIVSHVIFQFIFIWNKNSKNARSCMHSVWPS